MGTVTVQSPEMSGYRGVSHANGYSSIKNGVKQYHMAMYGGVRTDVFLKKRLVVLDKAANVQLAHSKREVRYCADKFSLGLLSKIVQGNVNFEQKKCKDVTPRVLNEQ